uniref:Centrobin-like n=1 Tax=Phallusia mammillata TaxID=59560 RepID=A0A6F9DAH0_9ASCI|nr:centrobin-like [Phallusia mammillata]
METQISEEDLLSGIELLPVSQPDTPNYNFGKDASLSSGLDDSISPVKFSTTQSPTKNPASQFTSSIHQVQKRLQDSLASSLRKEVQMKSSWQASPGEILKGKGDFLGHTPEKNSDVPFYTSALSKQPFLTIPSVEIKSSTNSVLSAQEPRSKLGPNVCPSSEFPSNISPIKQETSLSSEKANDCEKSMEQAELTLNDAHTKKLLDFMKKLEKGSEIQRNSAEQLAELTALLKTGPSTPTEKSCGKNQEKTSDLKQNVDRGNTKATREKFSAKDGKENTQLKTLQRAREKLTGNRLGNETSGGRNSKATGKPPATKTVQFKTSVKQDSSKRPTKPKQDKTKPIRKLDKPQNGEKMSKNKQQSVEVVPEVKEEEPSKAVSDMISVRNHLQTMLGLHKVDALALDSSGPDLYDTTNDTKDEDTFRSTDTATLLRTKPTDLMPPISPPKPLADSYTSDMFSILKAGKVSAPESARSSIDSSLTAENGILRDTLEKERYRRKHCEKQIQKLQKKMLEIQQELAVANSTERKKDLMIEQLDKTLAKVVDGWKDHEANLSNSIQQLTQEKEKHKEDTVKLKEMVVNLENELAKVLEELVEEKERINKAVENEKAMKQNYHARTEEISEVIDQKNETINRMQQKNDELVKECDQWKNEVEKHRHKFISEKKDFVTKEEEWEEAIIELEKKHKHDLEQEKASVEAERKRCSEMQASLSSTLQETRRMEDLLEAQRRELESMCTQAELAETRHAAEIRKMEAEHKIDIERQITEKLSRVHEEAQRNENSIRESHKKQVLEFIESHKREIESQCQRYEDELQKRDAAMRKAIADKERDFDDKLKSKGENVRQMMMSKMQNLLQAHYNETLQVVGTATGETPQKSLGLESTLNRLTGDFNHSTLADTLTKSTHPDMLHSLRSTQLVPHGSLPDFGREHETLPPSSTGFHSYAPVAACIGTNTTHAMDNFQPSTNTFVPLTASERYDATHLLDAGDDGEALPNLSLISSISHSTVASLANPAGKEAVFLQQQQQTQPHLAVVTSTQQATAEARMLSGIRMETEKITSFPIDTVAELNARSTTLSNNDSQNPNPVNRDSQLQRYIQMLLERPPGDPLNSSKLNQSKQESDTPMIQQREENKENQSTLSVPTSNALMQLINQHVHASPDLVPVKQINSGISVRRATQQPVNTRPALPSSKAKSKTVVAGQQPKRVKPNVHFAQELEIPAISRAPVNTTTTPTLPAPVDVFSPAQMGEISRMLGLYTANDTPTGETKFAAEQLLHYLRDKQTPAVVTSSVQPTVTSSPMDARRIKLQGKQQGAFKEPSALGKGRTTPAYASPGKPFPAWK